MNNGNEVKKGRGGWIPILSGIVFIVLLAAAVVSVYLYQRSRVAEVVKTDISLDITE